MRIFNFPFSIHTVSLEMTLYFMGEFSFQFMQLAKIKRTEISWPHRHIINTVLLFFQKEAEVRAELAVGVYCIIYCLSL